MTTAFDPFLRKAIDAMSLLPIVKLPDPILRTQSAPVEAFDERLRRLVSDMYETMYAAPGVGLAAIQVGVPLRLVVLDVADKDEEKQPLTLINPRIVHFSDELREYEEGCLSLPDVLVEIERPALIKVAYQDLDGKLHERQVDGLLATAVQHEVDHLDGKLIIDFLTRLKRDIVVRRFKKQARVG
jgi:peptide deformylase